MLVIDAPLRGRVALVTGGNQGIGAASAVRLGELGADVAATYLRLPDGEDDPGRPVAYARARRANSDGTPRTRRGLGKDRSLTSGGPMGCPGEVSYGAAKAALDNYTMAASIELAALGITANVVYPPVTDTGWVTEAVRRFVAQSRDHVHVAAASEVADVIGWLCTDAARLVSGNIIRLR